MLCIRRNISVCAARRSINLMLSGDIECKCGGNWKGKRLLELLLLPKGRGGKTGVLWRPQIELFVANASSTWDSLQQNNDGWG